MARSMKLGFASEGKKVQLKFFISNEMNSRQILDQVINFQMKKIK